MAIKVQTNFDVETALPIDSRMIFTNLAARDALNALYRYEGMFCFVISEAMNYQLVGGIANANWVEFAGGGSGGGVLVVQDVPDLLAIPDDDRYDGLLVYVIDEQELFQLRGGIDDSDWKAFDELYVKFVDTASIVFATDASGAATQIPYSTGASMIDTFALRTAQGQLRAETLAATDPQANAKDLINRSFLTTALRMIVSNTQSIADGGTITRQGGVEERVVVQGNVAGDASNVTISNVPAPQDGDRLIIVGNSSTSPVMVNYHSDLTVYLTADQAAEFNYVVNKWVKVGGV